MSLNVLQQRFLEQWRIAGGVNAPYRSMVESRVSDHIISVICKDRIGWVYDHVGDRHNEANGIRLEGEVFNALPSDELENRLELYANVTTRGRPLKVEEIGITALSRQTWTSRIYVATKPPAGASAAVVGVCEWQYNCELLGLDFITDLVERLCPPWIVEIFRQQDPATMQTRAKILTMLAKGDFGEVSSAELVALSLAVTQLKNSVELGVRPEVVLG